MNVLNQLTLRNLKLNRKRTIVTIIGIILSGAMICGVATLVASFQNFMIRTTEMDAGKHHATLSGVTVENSKYITGHANTETSMFSDILGYAPLEGSQNERKPYLYVRAYDEAAFAHFPITLTEGRFPEAPGEIVVSEEVIYSGGVQLAIGDTLELMIGQRVDGGEVLREHPLSETETFEPIGSETYTVVGLLKHPGFESYVSPGYTAITYLDIESLQPDDTVDVSIVAKKPRLIFETVSELEQTTQAAGKSYNNELLRWMGITNNSALSDLFEAIGLIIILLIVVGSISVIYNSFAISVSERKKQFGMLSSVGATNKQIRGMVYREAFILGLIGIPIGILSGIGGIGITLEVINNLMAGSFFNSGTNLQLTVKPQTVLISVGFMALTIFLSAFIPAGRAARITPIDAIRLTTDIQIKGKKLRTSRIIRMLFGIEGEIALKNLKRHRKRYRATVFSLFISIVLYVSFSSFMTYGFSSSEMYYADAGFDYVVTKDGIPLEEQLALYEEVTKLQGITEHSVVRRVDMKWSALEREQFGDYIQNKLLQDERTQIYYGNGEDGTYYMGVHLVSLGATAFAEYTEKLGLQASEFDNPEEITAIVVNWNKISYPVLAEFEPLSIEVGTKITLRDTFFDNSEATPSLDVRIGAVTNELPFGGLYYEIGYVNLIVSDETMQRIIPQLHEFNQENAEHASLFMNLAEDVDRAALTKAIESLDKRLNPSAYLSITDMKAMQEEMKRTTIAISIFLYGFVVLIALIGVTNIFNTISTNVALRRREFAMLRSIGMTPAGFNRMMNYESIFYGIKALLYGLPVSVLISIWMYNSMNSVFDFTFVLPWKEIAVCIVSVFIIVFITMMHASSKLKKENIIDALKVENL